MKEFVIGTITIMFIMCICVVGKGINLYNAHITLKTQIEAKQKDNQAIFDNTWKKISQTVQVSDKYKDGLKEVLIAYTDGRSKNSDTLLMDWTKEAVPTFDSSLYKQINNVIISSRDDFTKNQKMLLDLSQQHNRMIQTFPNNVYCMILHIKPIEIQIVTSTKTQETFTSGKEDNIRL